MEMRSVHTFLWLAVALVAYAAAGNVADCEDTSAVYEPSPLPVVDMMLAVAGLSSEDYIVDMGAGDGRVLLRAAQQYGAFGHAAEWQEELVTKATTTAEKNGLSNAIEYRLEDMFKTDLSRASVVTMYLLPGVIEKLAPKLYKELRPGARIISHDYALPAKYTFAERVEAKHQEKVDITGVPTTVVYKYVVPDPHEKKTTGPVSFNLKKQFAFEHSHRTQKRFVSAGKSNFRCLLSVVQEEHTIKEIVVSFASPQRVAPFIITAHTKDGVTVTDPSRSEWHKAEEVQHIAFPLMNVSKRTALAIHPEITVDIETAANARKTYFTYELGGLDKIPDGKYDLEPANASMGVGFIVELKGRSLGWWVLRHAPMPLVEFTLISKLSGKIVSYFASNPLSNGIGFGTFYSNLNRAPNERYVLMATFYERKRTHHASVRIESWAALMKPLMVPGETNNKNFMRAREELSVVIDADREASAASIHLYGKATDTMRDVQIEVVGPDGHETLFLEEQMSPEPHESFPFGWDHVLAYEEGYGGGDTVTINIYFSDSEPKYH